MGKVSINKTGKNLKNSIIEAINLLGGLEKYIKHDDVVMLKPNINDTEAITNIKVVEFIIQILQEYKVKKIIIAESSFSDAQMTYFFFEKTGYKDLAKRYNLNLINLNNSEVVEKKVEKPLLIHQLNIAKEVFEVNKIINLPVMKVHYATGITLAMKNLKGLLVGNEKKYFHEIGLDKAITDLNNTISPCLHIVDCTSCMERMGPRGGDIVKLNMILAGENCAEVDYIGSKIMGYTLDEVKHLQYYIKFNNINLDEIEIVGEKIENVKYNFKKVAMDQIIPEQIKLHNTNACSSCMNAVILSCQLIEEEIDKDIHIFLGSKLNEKLENGINIGFGNCCLRNNIYDKMIKGCPPYPFTLKKVIKEF